MTDELTEAGAVRAVGAVGAAAGAGAARAGASVGVADRDARGATGVGADRRRRRAGQVRAAARSRRGQLVLAALLVLGLVVSALAAAPTSPSTTTRFGYNVWRQGTESYEEALARSTTKYGSPEVLRTFYPGLPSAWPGPAGAAGDVVVSFKVLPSDILSGSLDATFRTWFRAAPRDRTVYWTYFHEPEDDIERGSFTASDYRAAWRRLDGLADESGNPRLKATPVLMCWSAMSRSGRNWRDYYAGSDVVDVLGWDCYNTGAKSGVYKAPRTIFGVAKTTSESVDKPWGIAEMGSTVVTGDDGTRRAQWLNDSVTWLAGSGATWAAYFDAPVGREYRLTDIPSSSAWKSAIAR